MPTQMTRADQRQPADTWGAETARTVHRHLVAIADEHGVVTASNRDIADALDISPATARRAIDHLRRNGGLELLLRGTGGRYPSRYRVLQPTGARRTVA